jgi:hypothetical protein
MAKIVQLTTNSWLLRAGDAASGLLFRSPEGYLFLNPKTRLNFSTIEDVEAKFGTLKEIEREQEQTLLVLNNIPVKHADFVAVPGTEYEYTKGNTKTVFAAGYWGLKFNQGWTQAFCPKKATLDSNEHVGPFKNRLEMLNHLTMLNNTENLRALGHGSSE